VSANQQQVTAEIAARVRAARTERQWTLDALAARSGVSRRMLVQIEHADANPSLATLLKLAAALDITLTELVSEQVPDRAVGVAVRHDAKTLWSTANGSAARLLVSRGPLELWSWTLAPGDRRTSDPHRPGSLELLSVHEGSVVLDVDDQHVEVQVGDSAWLDATRPHAYRNPGRMAATFTLAVLEPA
jgi:transcriptional regulator with XRE-family HTH domain